MELREILSRCDHTLLRVDATAAEIRALCDQGMRYGCASVCIPPCHVAGAKKYVGDRLIYKMESTAYKNDLTAADTAGLFD